MFKKKTARIIIKLCIFIIALFNTQRLESQSLFLPAEFGKVKSMEELKFSAVHEQDADESCGLSVLASILNLYLGIETNEKELLDLLREDINLENRVNMQQMMQAFKHYSFQTKAYKMDIENLRKAVNLYAPIIVHYDRPKPHFAFILFMDDKKIVIADPALGINVDSINTFKNKWSKTALLIKIPDGELNESILNKGISDALNKYYLLKRMARRK